jgi:subtilisin family serine protease
MRRFLCVSIGVGLLAFTAQPSTQSPSAPGLVEHVDGREAAAGEVLVKLRGLAPAAELGAVRALAAAESDTVVGFTGVRRLRSRSLSAAELVRRLAGHPDVVYAEPNYVVRAVATPSDPMMPQLWGLLNTGQPINGIPGLPGADIHATQAWDVSFGSKGYVVAVVDTGIDYTHPDLAANMWSAPTPFTVTIGGVPITCAAGTHGFNAITRTCDPRDDHNHGTHVAGTIGAAANNGIGVVGVNWVTELMAIKFLDAGGGGTIADAVAGIEFAIQAKRAFAGSGGANVRVLSNSWGSREFSQTLADTIVLANAENMLFVAAAGNDGISNDLLPFYPAGYSFPNVVAVAATTSADQRAFFSNYGATTVHLGAPGVEILSTTRNNTYSYFSGTSMAAPHVSGAAALVLSRCTLNTAQLKNTILSTVEGVAGLAGFTVTGGRLDVNSAIRSCVAPPSAPENLKAVGGDGRVTLTWAGAAGATGSTIKRSLVPGGPYTTIATEVPLRTYVDTAVVNETTYYYRVSARNLLGESANSNEASAMPKAPSDLSIWSLMTANAAGSGRPLAVSETTRNQGTGKSVATMTRFYLSPDLSLGVGDVLLNGVHAVPLLQPGTMHSASITVDVPPNVPTGEYFLLARADADDVEAESSEFNNIAARALKIGPDLAVSIVTAPNVTGAGSTIGVTDATRNDGGGATGVVTTTRFYLSRDSVFDTTDVLLAGGRTVNSLAPAESNTGSSTLTIPAGTPGGVYYLLARADADSVLVETQEFNNTALRQLQVGGDLTVSSLTVPSRGGAGASVVISDTTSNTGGGAVAASTTRFYLSSNSSLDAGDVLLPGGRSVPALDPGTSSTGSTTTTLPTGTPTGTYYIIAKADADDAVTEPQEANNTSARTITLGVDLIVSAFTAPATGGAGSTIVVTDTVMNQGGGPAGASVTRVYLSTNTTLDAGDTALSGSRAIGPLGGGESSTGTMTVGIPAGVAPGSYFLIALADADASVAEASETNNTATRTITIGPDLRVWGLAVNNSIAAGATVSVSDTAWNQGGGNAGQSTTRYYLSRDLSLDAGDVLLSPGRSVPPLAAGAFVDGSTPVTIPATTAPGAYFILAKADGDGQVAESVEANNVAARAVNVIPGS